jgi:hypothetical protein
MGTLIKNIIKSLFQNRITKYEDSNIFEISAADARVFAESEYNFKLNQVKNNPIKYQNKVYKKIFEDAKFRVNNIHYVEDKHEAILILNNVNGFHDKLIELGYTIQKPSESKKLYIYWSGSETK